VREFLFLDQLVVFGSSRARKERFAKENSERPNNHHGIIIA